MTTFECSRVSDPKLKIFVAHKDMGLTSCTDAAGKQYAAYVSRFTMLGGETFYSTVDEKLVLHSGPDFRLQQDALAAREHDIDLNTAVER